MPVESWMKPEDTAALAAEATALIDAALGRLPESDRTAFWESIRRCYNAPYNDPTARELPVRDLLEASATTAHTASSIIDLPTADIGGTVPTPVEVTMGAILGVSAFASEAHPT